MCLILYFLLYSALYTELQLYPFHPPNPWLKVTDLQRYPGPTFGSGAYTAEDIRWCEATYDFLEHKIDDDGRAECNM